MKETYDIVVNFYRLAEVKRLSGKVSCNTRQPVRKVKDLPLIVHNPMWVKFADKYFYIGKEGLYRFWSWGKVRITSKDKIPEVIDKKREYSCVIYYKKDVISLLSSIAYLQVHGPIHQELSFTKQLRLLKRGMLSLTCGHISDFCAELLKRFGIKARRVALLRVRGEYNTYDNGHQLLEFYSDRYRKWILADVDTNQLFVRDGEFLSLGEVSLLVQEGRDFELFPLTSSGIVRVDSTEAVMGEFPGYEQFVHRFMCKEGIKEWLRGMLEGPLMIEDGKLCFFQIDKRKARRIKRYYPQAVELNKEEWFERFYGGKAK